MRNVYLNAENRIRKAQIKTRLQYSEYQLFPEEEILSGEGGARLKDAARNWMESKLI